MNCLVYLATLNVLCTSSDINPNPHIVHKRKTSVLSLEMLEDGADTDTIGATGWDEKAALSEAEVIQYKASSPRGPRVQRRWLNPYSAISTNSV